MTSKRRRGAPSKISLPPKLPAKLAPAAPWENSARFLQSSDGLPKKFTWTDQRRTGHTNAHGEMLVAAAKRIMTAPIGPRVPAFLDRFGGDIYRFEVKTGFMAVATQDGMIKTCFDPAASMSRAGEPPDQHLRKLALVDEVNRTGRSLSELGQAKVRTDKIKKRFCI